MGTLRPQAKQCTKCTQYYRPKDSETRVGLRFRMIGHDLEFCRACTAKSRFELDVWLAKTGNTLRTLPQYDTKARRHSLVLLTDPADYTTEPTGGSVGLVTPSGAPAPRTIQN